MNASSIHIIGASGSGTTTLGRALAHRSGHRFLDADDYFWESTEPPFQTARPAAERLTLLSGDLAHAGAFILSGSVCDWDAALEASFDLIVFLYVPPAVRLRRLAARERERHGAVDRRFMAWAARYDHGDLTVRSRARHERWLAARRCPVVRLEGDLTTAERLAVLDPHLGEG